MFSQDGCSVSTLLHELRAPRPLLDAVMGYPLLLLQGKLKGKKLYFFAIKKSKKQMFHIKICACFSLSHMLTFFQTTVPCTVSAAAAGEEVKSFHSER